MFAWTEESASFWDDSARYTRCYDQLAEKAVPHLAPGSTVFEGGCGLGHLSVAIAKSGFPVTGMDLSPMPLQYLLRSAAQADIPLTVREGDIFSIPEKEMFDNAVFCFFGGVKETLLWAKAHCRDKVILFKKNWNTHRFTKDQEAVRRYTFPLTLEELDALGASYETAVFDLDMGQPFRDLQSAERFFRLYDAEGAMTEAEILSRVSATGDSIFPYYLPAKRPVGMIVLQSESIRRLKTI